MLEFAKIFAVEIFEITLIKRIIKRLFQSFYPGLFCAVMINQRNEKITISESKLIFTVYFEIFDKILDAEYPHNITEIFGKVLAGLFKFCDRNGSCFFACRNFFLKKLFKREVAVRRFILIILVDNLNKVNCSFHMTTSLVK